MTQYARKGILSRWDRIRLTVASLCPNSSSLRQRSGFRQDCKPPSLFRVAPDPNRPTMSSTLILMPVSPLREFLSRKNGLHHFLLPPGCSTPFLIGSMYGSGPAA